MLLDDMLQRNMFRVLTFIPFFTYFFSGFHIVSRLIEGDHIYSREDALVDVQHHNFSSTALPLPLGPDMIALNTSSGTTSYFDCGNP